MYQSWDNGLAKQRIFRIGVLILLLTALIGAKGGSAAAGPLPQSGEPVVSTRAGGLTIQWAIPKAEVITNADGRLEAVIPGLERDTAPGEPQLPVKSLLIALPPAGTPTVQISSKNSRFEVISAPLALAPGAEQTTEAAGAGTGAVKAGLPVQLEEVGILRGVRLGRLVLRPVVPQGSQLEIYTYLQVELDFNGPLSPTPAGGDVMIEQVIGMVANPDQVQSTLKDARPAVTIPQPAQVVYPRMAMQIEQAGLYMISYAELAEAAFPVGSVIPRRMHITHAGQEVAVELVGDGDDVFEAGEGLRFYASPRTQRWSTYDTYFLSVSSTTDAPLMASRSVAPAGAAAGVIEAEKLFEQNLFYPFIDPVYGPIDAGRDGDRWMWDVIPYYVNEITYFSRNYAFDLGNVDPTQTGSITIYLNGKTTGTNNVTVKIKNSTIGTFSWTGKVAKSQTIAIPTGLLADSGNTLTLSLSGTVAGFWTDAFSVRYKPDTTVLNADSAFFGQASGTLTYTAYLSGAASTLLYDTSSPHTPVRLTGFTNPTTSSLSFQDTSSGTPRSYLAAVTIRQVTYPETLRTSPALQAAPVGGAEYLVIAHPNFLAGSAPLAAHRASKGFTVVTENAQAIFDAYGEGLPTPQAIKAYLQNVYDTWAEVPQYVVLVGDGTWDPKHYQSATPSYIPPYLYMIDKQGEYAADNRYVTLDGPDNLPDMMIGRLPVNDTSQLATMIDKIINYENNPPGGDWRRRGTIIADYPFIDWGDYDFVLTSNKFYSKMPPAPYLREKIYYKVNYLTGATTKAAIVAAWNKGTAVLTFTGHASWHAWGGKYISETLKNEELFHLNDVPSLTNGYKLPVVLEFNCESSRFDHPGFDMLDEALVRKSNGGAIITFGPTSPGYTGSHEKLGLGFLTDLHSGEATAGTAMQAAKLYLSITDPLNLYLADTYTILGDPGVKVQLEFPVGTIYLPVINK